ncbi:MAG: VOC family protein [Planctomycetota bacterium]
MTAIPGPDNPGPDNPGPDNPGPDNPGPTLSIQELNHVALHVADVAVSCQFYSEVLKLPAIDRPDFDFPGAWFALGEQELHLIGERDLPTASHHRGTHFALAVEDISVWDSHLNDCGARRTELKHRPDGARQIFVIDPDNHWVELCQAPG